MGGFFGNGSTLSTVSTNVFGAGLVVALAFVGLVLALAFVGSSGYGSTLSTESTYR